MVDRLGLLQFDPLEVPGARSHDLILHSRIAGYRREWCERWLYPSDGDPRDRRLIELYNKSLNILPIDELPHYAIGLGRLRASTTATGSCARSRPSPRRSSSASGSRWSALDRGVPEHSHAIDWWWAPTRAARAVLEALFVTGRLGIARREGNRRYYDLIERIVPADLLGRGRAPTTPCAIGC